jgi:Mg2+ and Co2+ transporter CorA
MGWARMLLLGNVGQQLDIDDIESDVSQLRARIQTQHTVDREQNDTIASLRRDVTDLQLMVGELARLLVASGTLPREAMEHVVRGVDLGDG